MAENLSAFLRQNAIQVANQKVVASKRFVDENGNPIAWEVRGITAKEDEALRNSCTMRKQVPGKKNLYQPETDINQYLRKLAVTCTVYPDLNDATLQDSYGVMGAEALITQMLLPGEYAEYMRAIQGICGFDEDMSELVDEAKN